MFLATLTAALLSLTAIPGDWLVTIDGDRIETRGPWQVKGSRVVFTLPSGTLSVARLSRIDLEASRAASRPQPDPQVESGPRAPAEDRPPALVLGVYDIARHAPASATSSEGVDLEPEARLDLHVANWEDVSSPQVRGLRFRGLITNAADTFAADLKLQVTLFARDGGVIDTLRARIARPSLDVQSSTSFDAFFPDQYSYDRVEFDLQGRPLLRRDPSVPSFEETEASTESAAPAVIPPPTSGAESG